MSDGTGGHPREALSSYLDDELGVEERSTIDRHLAVCEDCRVALEALLILARAVRNEGVPPPPVDLAGRIGRRLDGPAIKGPRMRRFVVPATIAATVGAVGLFVALQWREGRLVPQPQTESKSTTAIERETAPAREPSPQLAPGTGAAGDERRDAAAPIVTAVPIPPCGDRWLDSRVRGTWASWDTGLAAAALDRMAHDFGGSGVWRGAADGRPYVMVVPRSRFDEAFFALRARGVTGLDELPVLPAGTVCVGISVALVKA